MNELMLRLPECYQNSVQVRELERILGNMTGGAADAVEETLDQLFPQTAYGWGLRLWEEAYGIPVDLSRPLEFRRTRVISKLRGQGTSTVEMIQSVAESFTNGRAEIVEHNDEFYFVVRFVSQYGVPPNIEDLQAAINEIKPAHLAFIFEYLYRTWGQVKPFTWGALAMRQWRDVKESELN